MTFKKLALASAIAMVPAVAFSAEPLDDSTLSGVTGQDGVQISITTMGPVGGDIYIHDTDGITAVSTTYSFDGAIVIEGFSINGSIDIDIDAGDSAQAGSDPVLQVAISIPTATLVTGNISVANSQRDDASASWGINTQSGTLLDSMTVVLAGVDMNVQLGNEPQGNMIALSSTVTSGLSISNFALNDAGGAVTGGALGAANIVIKDNGASTDLGLDVGVDASTDGLVIDVNYMGDAVNGMDFRVTDAYLGTTSAGIVGDVTVVGLNLNGSQITISGK